ncbi:outer membrane beta-barrel protein [Iodobacter sp. HSC-16F04]|uniref:Outer membrane beta-barrel protein n=1 Tax=Iodobacter violaceini TaxID=3044271 RepID=A0ABX0KXJ5_9NEIS|nr:outer membrane beta-barrel protein [Iodobacter violacea]NHQ88521.1 outer membrane beta-barrel protein [Iodobacter violacea]
MFTAKPVSGLIALALAMSATASISYADEQPKAISSADLLDKLSSPNSTKPKPSFDAKEFADTGRQSPSAIEAGPFFIYPTLGIAVGRDSNVTRTNRNEIASTAALISPSIVADLLNNGDRYVFGYNGKFLRYFDSKENNTNSNELQFQAQNAYSARLSSLILSNLLYAEDAQGTTDSGSSTPDKYRSFGLKGLVAYGAAEATGRIELEAGVQNKRYSNNQNVTRFFDQDSLSAAARFFYRVAPKTSLVFEGRVQNFDYLVNPDLQNSKEYRFYTGATWDADDYFTGTVKVGVLNKNYDTSTKEDFTKFSYEALLRFTPLTYSSFELSALRTPSEATGSGNFLLDDVLNLQWNHAWSSYLSTRTYLNYVQSDYSGITRTDNTYAAGLGVDYKLTRWLKTGAELRYEKRNSNITEQDYQRNLFMVNLSGSL